ncbi:hypothetical protein KIN20_012112 [Parelaphostrongylus tenuis]|uniref:Uncharacterized protein n=1 Tax=Parelaphostrongylus tenuis TaxID=148309 RepID=A0AAD5QLL7_PARTN|nr:hypothetical protein KIN20_012112 [Parelaphostrongylus tenuis]
MNELLLPAFFDDLRIDDDANHVLKATTGNGIRFDDDAVPVMSPQAHIIAHIASFVDQVV